VIVVIVARREAVHQNIAEGMALRAHRGIARGAQAGLHHHVVFRLSLMVRFAVEGGMLGARPVAALAIDAEIEPRRLVDDLLRIEILLLLADMAGVAALIRCV